MKRSYAALLEEYLSYFPVVAILGPRQCGKTTFVRQSLGDWAHFDLEQRADFNLIQEDPDLFLRLNSHGVVVDEAQLLPDLFRALRVAVDDDRQTPGRFVVTGSSSPELSEAIAESLAGRVATIEMAPLSLSEAFESPPSQLFDLFASPPSASEAARTTALRDLQHQLKPRIPLGETQRYWLRGGYPEPWLANDPRFFALWPEQYVQSYLQRDIASLFPGLDRPKYQLFLGLLASLSGSVINYSEVARHLGVSAPTARDYFHIAHGTFVWRTLPAFTPQVAKRLTKHPKGFLRDSGLLHHLLHIDTLDLLYRHRRKGASFEGMVVEQLLRGLAVRGLPHQAYHYRTSAGAEVDLVLEGKFGLVPVEIKHTQDVPRRQLRALRDFVETYDAPFGLVINNDTQVRRYDDRLLGVPLTCL